MSSVGELAARLEPLAPAERDGLFGVRVPLRICPLGAHVDHQGGEVTGLALDHGVSLAAVPSDEPVVRLESLDFPGAVKLCFDAIPPRPQGDWGDYLRAAAAVLGARHSLRRGFRACLKGDFPGTGLSSSAAVLVAYLTALAEVNGIELEPRDTARLVQEAENAYIGLASGLLDPSMMLFARRGALTHLDCASFAVEYVPVGACAPSFKVLVAFSGISRSLVATSYNSRVEECREAARRLGAGGVGGADGVARLRDVDPQRFATAGASLPTNLRRRAAHFFGEMRRVREGIVAWRRGDLACFGELMNASGESSIVNFESGTAPLISLFEALRGSEGVFGARFSGAGFGGSCIALVHERGAQDVVGEVRSIYGRDFPELAAAAHFELCGLGQAVEMQRGGW